MLLAIDAGNTNIVFAVYSGDIQKASWRIRSEKGRTADEYTAWLYPLFQSVGLSFVDIQDVIICSVIPDENFNLQALCQKTFQTSPLMIGNDLHDIGIEVDLPKPDEVGADRLMNAVSIVQFYKYPAVVVDFGTSTNFDIINAQGAFCGGVLAPGVNLSMKALHDAAAKLPKVSIRKPESVIGRDTVSAMQSGLYFGYISMIEGLINRISENFDTKPFILATGGLAQLFADGLPLIDKVDHDLTLKGLLHVYQNHCKQ